MIVKKHLTKENIIIASIELFGEYGVDNISMNDIAEACNIRKASLYSHFKSRDIIISEAYRYGLTLYYNRIHAVASSDEDYLDNIKNMIHVIIDLHDENTNLFRFLVMNQYAQIKLPYVVEGVNLIEYFTSVLKHGMETKQFPHKDENVLALAITGIIIQQSVGLMFGRLQKNLSQYKEKIWKMCYALIMLKED